MKPAPDAVSRTGRGDAWVAALIAAGLFALSTLVFGLLLPGYSQSAHPVALLGARGIAHAAAFDACGFVLPGLLAAHVCLRLRGGLPAAVRWPARIGATLGLLAACAFALQGVLPIDPEDLESAVGRAHAFAWSAWWIAFAAAAALLALARDVHPDARAWRAACACAGVLVVVLAISPWPPMPAPVAQRLAFAVWFGWLLAAARRV